MELEDLLQQASNNYALRLEALRHAVKVAARAAAMGPGAVRAVASELHYSTAYVKKLAEMGDLPDDLISVDMKVGAYHTAIRYAKEAWLTPREAVERALLAGCDTPAKVKELLGVETGGHAPPLFDEIVSTRAPLLFNDAWPERVRVRVTEAG